MLGTKELNLLLVFNAQKTMFPGEVLHYIFPSKKDDLTEKSEAMTSRQETVRNSNFSSYKILPKIRSKNEAQV